MHCHHSSSLAAAFLMISATLATIWVAWSWLPDATASRIEGKYSISSPERRGPKTTCLNCVRLGI